MTTDKRNGGVASSVDVKRHRRGVPLRQACYFKQWVAVVFFLSIIFENLYVQILRNNNDSDYPSFFNLPKVETKFINFFLSQKCIYITFSWKQVSSRRDTAVLSRVESTRGWGHDRRHEEWPVALDKVNETSPMFDTVALSSVIFCPRGPASIIRVIGISIHRNRSQRTVGKRASRHQPWGS